MKTKSNSQPKSLSTLYIMASSPIIAGFVTAMLAWIFMYLDTRILDNPKSKTTYAKNMLMVGSLTALVVYVMGSSASLPAYAASVPASLATINGTGINEEILTGIPDF